MAGEGGVADDDVDVGERRQVQKLAHVLPQLGALLNKDEKVQLDEILPVLAEFLPLKPVT